jgi:hypothetical protein
MARDFVMTVMADEPRALRVFAPALVLLAICALINYVDRGNLSTAAPLLKNELRISVTDRRMDGIAKREDSFDANRVIAAGFVLWSLTTAASQVSWPRRSPDF